MAPVPSRPSSETGNARWIVFATTFSVATGLVGVLSSLISFSTGPTKILAALACALAAGLMWQAFRERISRRLVGWLLGTGLATVLLIIVVSDAARTAPAVVGDGDQAAGSDLTAESANPSPRPAPPPENAPQEATPSPALATPGSLAADQTPLDELPVVDGGEDWAQGDKSISGEPYERTLIASDYCEDAFISYNLYREWSRFTVSIGIPDDAPTGSLAYFTVVADENEIYNRDSAFVPGDVVPLDLNVDGVFRLTLKVRSDCSGANPAAWGNPTLHR